MKRQYILQRVAGPVEKHDSFFRNMNNLRSFLIVFNFLTFQLLLTFCSLKQMLFAPSLAIGILNGCGQSCGTSVDHLLKNFTLFFLFLFSSPSANDVS